jgi:hypothetical protein
LFFCFPFFPKTFPKKQFFKRKNGKKESQKSGREPARENYKSRRVAAAQRRTLCVRTGRLTEIDASFVRFLWEIATESNLIF